MISQIDKTELLERFFTLCVFSHPIKTSCEAFPSSVGQMKLAMQLQKRINPTWFGEC